jgi:hypothetical protein
VEPLPYTPAVTCRVCCKFESRNGDEVDELAEALRWYEVGLGIWAVLMVNLVSHALRLKSK